MSVIIRFEHGDLFRTINFDHGTSLYKAEQFANWLKGYTDAVITVVTATQTKNLPAGSEGSGPYASVDLYAKTLIKDSGEKTHELIIPAPKASVFDTEQRVTDEFGEALASRYATLAGSAFTFYRGALVGKS